MPQDAKPIKEHITENVNDRTIKSGYDYPRFDGTLDRDKAKSGHNPPKQDYTKGRY